MRKSIKTDSDFQNILSHLENLPSGGLTTASPGFILHSSSQQKPMTQTSSQNAFLPASRRQCEGGRNNSGEWTAEGGPNRSPVGRGERNETEWNFRRQVKMERWSFFRRSKLRRAFPPLPRKGMCWHTAERAISIANLGGTAEVSRLLSQRNLSQVLYDGMRVFF